MKYEVNIEVAFDCECLSGCSADCLSRLEFEVTTKTGFLVDVRHLGVSPNDNNEYVASAGHIQHLYAFLVSYNSDDTKGAWDDLGRLRVIDGNSPKEYLLRACDEIDNIVSKMDKDNDGHIDDGVFGPVSHLTHAIRKEVMSTINKKLNKMSLKQYIIVDNFTSDNQNIVVVIYDEHEGQAIQQAIDAGLVLDEDFDSGQLEIIESNIPLLKVEVPRSNPPSTPLATLEQMHALCMQLEDDISEIKLMGGLEESEDELETDIQSLTGNIQSIIDDINGDPNKN